VLAVAGWDHQQVADGGPASMSQSASFVLPGGWLLVPVRERSQARRQQQSLHEHLDLTLQQLKLPEIVKNMPNPASCEDKGGNTLRHTMCDDDMLDMGKRDGHHAGSKGVLPITEVPYDPIKDEVDSFLSGPAAVPPPVPVPPPPPPPPPPPVAPVVEAAIQDIAPAIHPMDCDSILDLDAWFECENNKRLHSHPEAALPPPAPPTIPKIGPPAAAEQDCDAITDDLDAWFACEDNRRLAMGM